MSFGREQEMKVLVFQLAVCVALGAGGAWLLKSLGYSGYNITRDDIEIIKDAADDLRELRRLAERIEDK